MATRNPEMSDSRDLLDTRSDPYAALGAKLNQSGLFLKFSKGEYVYGQNKEELKLGKRLVVNMPGTRLGWVRWQGGKPVENTMELLIDRPHIRERHELGHSDESMWERDDRGDAQDPWVLTYSLDLSDPANSEFYSFSTTSAGGKKAVGALLTLFSQKHRMEPDLLPIVELQRSSYNHPNPRFGKIYEPLLPVIGWIDANAPSVDDLNVPAEVPPGPGQRAANPTREAAPMTATRTSSTNLTSPSDPKQLTRF